MAGIYSLAPSIPAPVYPFVGALALIIGLLLAFFGESVFKMLTSVIGGIIGAVIGFAFGAALGGTIGAFIVAFIGAVIGGLLFYYVAEAGMALVIAYFVFDGVLYAAGSSPAGVTATSLTAVEVVAFIAGIAVFMVSIIFFKDIVAVITAVAGGLIVDYGLTFLHFGTFATIISIVVIVAGMVVQFTRLRSQKRIPVKGGRPAAVPDAPQGQLSPAAQEELDGEPGATSPLENDE